LLTETLTPDGPIHWGVMLAQGWKPVLEAWTTLAAHSQATKSMVIGTLVSCAGYRNVRLTVKMTETMTLISGGRFCLGLGAGWDRYEFESLDVPFPTAAERADRLEAGLHAFREIWPRASRGGQPGSDSARSPLLLVGGEGEKRTLPAAAAYADVTNWQVGVAEFAAKSRVLAERCEAIGRDPRTIRRTHAPNFQLFESERDFRRWRQSEDRGMSAKEVDAYIRDRGAFYGTADAICEVVERFLAAGCGGFMTFCNESPSARALEQLASVWGSCSSFSRIVTRA
jgi:alkanesulfonate monooxygenase SsuD/methylene tetrahydromethanopterin reductase-like flavin-dependent oxidoreductase (luciferase family)